jgi:LPXTG-motif cell wall-anchored protein
MLIAPRRPGRHRAARSKPVVLGLVVALTVAASVAVIGVGEVTGGAAASAAASSLVCDQNTLYPVTAADVTAGTVDNIATAGATLPGCSETRGSDTCPVVTSSPSSTRTSTQKPAVLASTGSDLEAYLLLGIGVLLLGFGLALIGRRRRVS